MPTKWRYRPAGADGGRNRRAVRPGHRARRRRHAHFGGASTGAVGVPIVGINHGRLGFLTDLAKAPCMNCCRDCSPVSIEEARALISRNFHRRRREHFAMNDVVVNRGTTASLVDLEISLNDRFAYGFRADGVIVATPTGSTAYALSAAAPILAPTVNAFTLAPIAPHALTMRPIVVADDSVIRITVARAREAVASIDGHHSMPLAEGDSVLLRRARTNVRLWHPLEYDYYHTLRHKLGWTEKRPRAVAAPRKRSPAHRAQTAFHPQLCPD